MNQRLAADQIRGALADIEPAVLIQHAATDRAPGRPGRPADRRRGPIQGALAFEALVAESPDDPVEVAVAMDDLCLLPHTRTVGAPKGVMLTHANLTWNVVNPELRRLPRRRRHGGHRPVLPGRRDRGERAADPVRWWHGGGAGRSGPGRILQAMERHRVTVGFGNPDLLDALARSEAWSQVDLSSVRFVVTGGAPVPERLIRGLAGPRGAAAAGLRAVGGGPAGACWTRPAPHQDGVGRPATAAGRHPIAPRPAGGPGRPAS